MSAYLLAHDLGTSGNKATLFSSDGSLQCSVIKEYPTRYPANGWVEQNADDWWNAVVTSTRELLAMSAIPAADIAAVSFSGQMMGCLLVDAQGNPLHPALIWADTRSAKQEADIIRKAGMERVYRITGHRASASYSAAKLLWLKENHPQCYRRAHKMLHAKDYIVYRLTGEFVTDYSDASGTNLLDLSARRWSDELLYALDIRKELLPQLHASTHVAGGVTHSAAQACGLAEGTPVVIGGGDGSCATVGAGVVREGGIYCVLGSSAWISIATAQPVYDQSMRTFTWLHLDETLYTPCGTMQAAGYSMHWLKNSLCPELTYQQLDDLAEQSGPGANGLMFLPYLLGERSPRWDHEARGAFIGLDITTDKGDMARAVMEGVALNLKIILDALQSSETGEPVRIIGGGAKSALWQQILADVWQRPLQRITHPQEATSMGAAVCGGVGVGLFEGFDEVSKFSKPLDTIKPNPDTAAIYQQLEPAFEMAYEGLKKANLILSDMRRKGDTQ